SLGYICDRELVENASRFSTLRLRQSEASTTTKAPEGAFVLSAIRRVPVSSEFIAEADHVDHRVDVYVDFHLVSSQIGSTGGINIDIANLSVDHEAVRQHIVSANLEGEAPGIFHVQPAEALAFGFAAQFVIEEPGVVDASANIGLEG